MLYDCSPRNYFQILAKVIRWCISEHGNDGNHSYRSIPGSIQKMFRNTKLLTFSPRLKQGDSCINHHCTATEAVASYTMSDRRYFPCVPRYGMYLSSGLLLKPFMQNINGSVFIAVVNRVTRRTFPLTDAEVLDSHILIAAATACLAARIECRYTNYCTTVPIGLRPLL